MIGFHGRDPGPLRLTGVRADPRALGSHLDALARAGRLVAADLTLGAWRNNHVAAEFLAQLGQPEPAASLAPPWDGPAAVVLPPRSEVGRRIDRETAGERAVRDAYVLATEVVRAVDGRAPRTFCVVVGRHGLGWEPADAAFVRLLAQGLRSTGHCLVLATGTAEPELPDDWEVGWTDLGGEVASGASRPASATALVPGILTPPVIAALAVADASSFIALPGGCLLVPPEQRVHPETVADERYERLARATAAISWLRAYATYHASGAGDVSWLWEQARQDFDAGGLVVPLRLLERAGPRARGGTQRAVFTLLAQAVRIVSGRFAAAADIEDIEPRLAPELRGWLWHTRGWALVMLDRPAEAERCLGCARDLLGARPDTDEYLYVLNISALNRLKAGDWDGAHALEQRIRASLPRIAVGQPQLRYINALNLARLWRRRDDLDAAEACYREAFATTRGLWSDSDAIYFHVCLAKLHEARGEAAAATRAWTRAALYWVSSPLPEAIAARVVAAILGPRAPANEGGFVDAVSAVFTARVVAGAPGRDADAAPTFIRADAWPGAAGGPWRAGRLADAWLFGVAGELAPIVESAANRRLRAALAGRIDPHGGSPVWLVDDRLGCGLPEDHEALLGAALRLGARSLRVDGATLELDEEARRRLAGALQVTLGSGVAEVVRADAGAIVTFKRYRAPRWISADECAMLSGLAGGARPAAELALDLARLRALEQERIVELVLAPAVTGGES